MSYKGTFDFVLHLESFRNIDLYQQGLYYLKFQVYQQEKNGQIIYAQPYSMIDGSQNKNFEKEQKPEDNPTKNKNKKLPDRGPWDIAKINDDLSYFQTQTFLIRYTEEEIELNDICYFKSEVDAYPSYDEHQFYIECDLMCADLTTFGTQKQQQQGEEQDLFKCVSSYKAKLNNVAMGIHEYMPISFDEQHFCQVHASFHSTLLDFKFRLSDYQLNVMNSKQSNQRSQIGSKNKENRMMGIGPVLLQPRNFTEFLNKVTRRFTIEQVNQFYDYYVNGLRDEYNTLSHFLKQLSEKAIPNLYKERYPSIFNKEFPVLEKPIYIQNWEAKQPVIEKPLGINQNYQNIYNNNTNNKSVQNKYQYSLKNNHQQLQQQDQRKITDFYQLNKIQEQERIANDILKEMNIISGNIFLLQNTLTEYLKVVPFGIIQHLGVDYHQKMRERWGESIFRNQLKTTDVTINTEPDAGKNHKYIAEKMREQAKHREFDQFQIENLNMFPSHLKQPILFEDIFMKERQINPLLSQVRANKISKDFQGTHLFILCHGFQGNSYDMRLFKNNLALVYPQALFLCSKSNEDFTDQDIAAQGKRLAQEVKSYVNEWCPNNLGRISFIGHSLGGVIIRAALPHLQEFSRKMYTFLTLSSPHLGYMHNTSKVIDAGIWILQKMRKSKSLFQLSLSDADEIEDTFLYKLTKQPGLNWFENVALVSSFQDQYIAFESARIQKFQEGTFNSSKGKKYRQMVDNLLYQMKSEKVHRIDVNFNITDLTLDSAIGRTAHILFLESDPLTKMFVYCLDHLFK